MFNTKVYLSHESFKNIEVLFFPSWNSYQIYQSESFIVQKVIDFHYIGQPTLIV